jgi:hypothetical protein
MQQSSRINAIGDNLSLGECCLSYIPALKQSLPYYAPYIEEYSGFIPTTDVKHYLSNIKHIRFPPKCFEIIDMSLLRA